jgi:hypothetical protein
MCVRSGIADVSSAGLISLVVTIVVTPSFVVWWRDFSGYSHVHDRICIENGDRF